MYISHAKLDQAKILISYLSNEILKEHIDTHNLTSPENATSEPQHINQDSNTAIINNFLITLPTRLKCLGQNKKSNLQKMSDFLFPGVKQQDINEISKVAIYAIKNEKLQINSIKNLIIDSLGSMKTLSDPPPIPQSNLGKKY